MRSEFQPLLDEIKSNLKSERGISAIVLFGSLARGKAGKRSDVDICIFIKKRNKRLEKKISNTLLDLEKKFNRSIQLVLLTSKLEGCDRQFLDTILREGVVLLGKFPSAPIQKLGLEPYSIIKYDLSSLPQADKMRIKRLLYGKKTTKKFKGKTYISTKKGLVEEVKGIRAGIASVLLPEKDSWHIERTLKELGVKTRKIRAWLPKV